MNWVDIFLISIIGYHALKGFNRGLIQLIMDMVAFGMAIYLSMKNGPVTAHWIETTLHQVRPVSTIVGYIGVWIGVYLVLSLIGRWISRMMPAIGLGSLNKLGGIIGGTVKGLLFCVPIMMPIQLFKADLLGNSILAPAMAPMVSQLSAKLFPATPPTQTPLPTTPSPPTAKSRRT
jgi:membrane protein required for colicin V production